MSVAAVCFYYKSALLFYPACTVLLSNSIIPACFHKPRARRYELLLLKQKISSKEALSYAMLPFHNCIQIEGRHLVATSTTWNSLVYTSCISNVCHCFHGMLIMKTAIWLFCAIKIGSVTRLPSVEPNHHNYTFTASLSD